jgi:hypothetical protein
MVQVQPSIQFSIGLSLVTHGVSVNSQLDRI